MIVEYDCEQCGAHVRKSRSPATMRGNSGRFCSQKCNGADRRGTGPGPTTNHEFTCAVCGRECRVYRSPSAPKPVTCSIECTGRKQSGAGNPSFSGGRRVAKSGYIRILAASHPDADSRGYVYVRADNRPENLMLFASHSEHMKHHAQEEK